MVIRNAAILASQRCNLRREERRRKQQAVTKQDRRLGVAARPGVFDPQRCAIDPLHRHGANLTLRFVLWVTTAVFLRKHRTLGAVIKLHHLERSRSHRVLWLLEELGVPYEIVEYKRNHETLLAPPSLTKVHPLGKSPVITDGDTTVAESGAIIEYLAERHGGANLVPAVGTAEHQRCRYFMHYAEGSLMPPLLIKLISSKIRSAKVPFFAKPITAKVADNLSASLVTGALIKHTAFLESELAQRQWMCGDHMTIADVQMSYPLEALASRSDAGTAMPNILRVLNAMRARPAYQRAIERGGPIMID